ncbi:MAG: hypothetical protein CM15mP49_19130 [Actinomycetota bacterium]|nr:MAG: hypothetical protein CM15mP49_19130 [Actinomycetota bacterium]
MPTVTRKINVSCSLAEAWEVLSDFGEILFGLECLSLLPVIAPSRRTGSNAKNSNWEFFSY